MFLQMFSQTMYWWSKYPSNQLLIRNSNHVMQRQPYVSVKAVGHAPLFIFKRHLLCSFSTSQYYMAKDFWDFILQVSYFIHIEVYWIFYYHVLNNSWFHVSIPNRISQNSYIYSIYNSLIARYLLYSSKTWSGDAHIMAPIFTCQLWSCNLQNINSCKQLYFEFLEYKNCGFVKVRLCVVKKWTLFERNLVF